MGDVDGEEAGEKVGYGESDELREGCSSRWLDRTRLSVMPCHISVQFDQMRRNIPDLSARRQKSCLLSSASQPLTPLQIARAAELPLMMTIQHILH